MTETAQRATLILPACSAFEKSGTTIDLAGDVLPVMGSVVAPGEAKADGDMLVLLADALDVGLPDPVELEQAVASAAGKAPRDGRALPAPSSAAPPVGATTSGSSSSRRSSPAAERRRSTSASRACAPSRAPSCIRRPRQRCGVSDGGSIDIASASGLGSLENLSVIVTERVPQGAVAHCRRSAGRAGQRACRKRREGNRGAGRCPGRGSSRWTPR